MTARSDGGEGLYFAELAAKHDAELALVGTRGLRGAKRPNDRAY